MGIRECSRGLSLNNTRGGGDPEGEWWLGADAVTDVELTHGFANLELRDGMVTGYVPKRREVCVHVQGVKAEVIFIGKKSRLAQGKEAREDNSW